MNGLTGLKTDKPIRVLVTGVSGGSIGEQVYKALRLGKHAYQIWTTNTSLVAMSVVKSDHQEILPPAASPEYLSALLTLIDKNDIQFLIPGSEPELIKISNNRDVFNPEMVQLLINSRDVITTCVDKHRTFEFLTEHGFHTPRTVVINDVGCLDTLTIPFPVIIKPAQGGGGSSFVFLAQEQDELRFFANYLIRYGYTPIVQEYLRDAAHEYTVGVLHTPDKHFIGSIVLQRQILSGLSNRLRISNRTDRYELGDVLAVSSGISQGKIVRCEPVQAQAEKIAEVLGSSGPLNIQGRWDGERFVLFEINPRFSGTTPMRAMANFNEPELLIDYHLNSTQSSSSINVKYGEFTRGLIEVFTPEAEDD